MSVLVFYGDPPGSYAIAAGRHLGGYGRINMVVHWSVLSINSSRVY